jgi:serine/threonine protein phosphatase 1
MKPRTLVIGDIHGAYKALEQVLLRTRVNDEDTLIFLGDYVDGWSQSSKVIDLLISLNQQQDCVFMLGNHDAWTRDWLNTRDANKAWLKYGGQSTLDSYNGFVQEDMERHIRFYNSLKNFYIDGRNNLFIHAGFSSMHGPQHEMYSSNFNWDRTLWEMALAMDPDMKQDSKLYPSRLKLFREIFIGHTPTTNYGIGVPMNAVNVWNVDTGAAFTGRVTAMDVVTKQFWQSDPVRTLYPDEKGRNKE